MRKLKDIKGKLFRDLILGLEGILNEDIVESTSLSRSQVSKEIKSSKGMNDGHRKEIYDYYKKCSYRPISEKDFWCFKIDLEKSKKII